MSDCSGACCAVFYLPFTISELRRRAETVEDGAYIADMVIPLTPKEARERGEQFGAAQTPRWADRGHHFTCRHWDEQTRLCTAYEERPRMCREYPYEAECSLGSGCSFRLCASARRSRRRRLAAQA